MQLKDNTKMELIVHHQMKIDHPPVFLRDQHLDLPWRKTDPIAGIQHCSGVLIELVLDLLAEESENNEKRKKNSKQIPQNVKVGIEVFLRFIVRGHSSSAKTFNIIVLQYFKVALELFYYY